MLTHAYSSGLWRYAPFRHHRIPVYIFAPIPHFPLSVATHLENKSQTANSSSTDRYPLGSMVARRSISAPAAKRRRREVDAHLAETLTKKQEALRKNDEHIYYYGDMRRAKNVLLARPAKGPLLRSRRLGRWRRRRCACSVGKWPHRNVRDAAASNEPRSTARQSAPVGFNSSEIWLAKSPATLIDRHSADVKRRTREKRSM